ncbi:uncharacterized protein LOC113375220 [Ctenocephalides felis]|uniref:uncharacterized protein LOC113375220 n=1 Tax=Ctenocephalides felis TaxID=7515 RepID=UPI000E6E287F|nr:uncharacterized protein LOC113375220 [Ctenocephalides felis]
MQGDPLTKTGRRYTRPESRNGLQDEYLSLNIPRRTAYSNVKQPQRSSSAAGSAAHGTLYVSPQHQYTEQQQAGRSDTALSQFYANQLDSTRNTSTPSIYCDTPSTATAYALPNAESNSNGTAPDFSNEAKICVMDTNGQYDAGQMWYNQPQMSESLNITHMNQGNQDGMI